MTSLENILAWNLCTTIPWSWMFSKGLDKVVMSLDNDQHTANKGLVRIQYKCLVPIYGIPEMKVYSLIISKTEL
jgi:hypothetical protein